MIDFHQRPDPDRFLRRTPTTHRLETNTIRNTRGSMLRGEFRTHVLLNRNLGRPPHSSTMEIETFPPSGVDTKSIPNKVAYTARPKKHRVRKIYYHCRLHTDCYVALCQAIGS
jgi:hypothetical protein